MDSHGLLELFVVCAVLVSAVSIVAETLRLGISPMPTAPRAKDIMIAAIPVDAAGTIVDLGSGWGTLAFAAAKRFPACEVIGFEASLVPFAFSKLRLLLFKHRNLGFVRRNFFEISLSDASVILCYLFPGAMRRISEKFDLEARGGALLISNTFSLPGHEPVRLKRADDLYRTPIYVYEATRE